MALTLAEVRKDNPIYDGVSDNAMFNDLHQTYYPDIPREEMARQMSYTLPELAPKPEDANADGDTVRGLKDSWTQTKQLGAGLLAGAGAGAEAIVGEGGFATGIKKAGVDAYREIGTELEATTKPSDSLTYSLDQAKAGDLGSLVDWAQHGIGNAVGQGVQGLATFGVGNLAGKAALTLAGKEFVEGLVVKEAAKIVAKQEAAKVAATESGIAVGEVLTGEALTAEATSLVANKFADAGGKAFVAGQAFGMEAGEIGGELADKSVKEGRALTGEEAAKGFGWSLAAGAVEFGGEMLGINAVLGKSKLINNLTGFADKTPGIMGRVQRGMAGGAALAPVEGVQEGIQTVAENYGQGKDPFSKAGLTDIVDSAGQGMLGGHTMGFIGGIAKAATVDDAIKAAGDSLNGDNQDIPPPPPETLRISNGGTVPDNQIVFDDGSQIHANDFFNDRMAEHGDDDRARGETFTALNGHPKPAIGIPHLIATANGDLINKTETLNGFLGNGATLEQANEYLKQITETPVSDRTPENLDTYRSIMAGKSDLPAPIVKIPDNEQAVDEAIAANDITLNQPALAVKTGFSSLSDFENKRNEDQRLAELDDLRKESELSTIQGTLDEQRKAHTHNTRIGILNSILEDDSIENKQAKFEAEVKRQGYSNTDLTPAEHSHLGKHLSILNANDAAEQEKIPTSDGDNQEQYYDPNKISAKSPSGEPASPVVTGNGLKAVSDAVPTTAPIESGSDPINSNGVSSPTLTVGDSISHSVNGTGVISNLISPKHAVIKWDDGSSSRAKIKSLTKTEEPVANEDNSADTAIFSSENYSNSEEAAKTEPVAESKKRTIAEISRDNHLAKPKTTRYGTTTKKEFVEKAVADGYKPVTEINYGQLDKDKATLSSHDAPAHPLQLPSQEAKALREKLSNEDNYKTIHTLAKDKEDGSTSIFDVSKHEYKHAEGLLRKPEDVIGSEKDNSPEHNQRVADMKDELKRKSEDSSRAEFTKKHNETPFAHSLINNDHEKANDDIYRGQVSKEDAKKILDDAVSTGLVNELTASKVSEEIDSKDTIDNSSSKQDSEESVIIDLNKNDKDGIPITEADIAAFMKNTETEVTNENGDVVGSESLASQLKAVRDEIAAYEKFKGCVSKNG